MSEVAGKPRFRGYFHQEAFFVALGACALLIAKSTNALSLTAAWVYSLGLLFLLGCSATYHRFNWAPKARVFLQRFDHSAIFVFIACTVTPIALLAIPAAQGKHLLFTIWAAAILGTLQSIFWVNAPKWVMAALCVGMGWLSFPYFSAFKAALTSGQLSLLIAGGIVYSLGAVFYATKTPKLWPRYFGYHELFHFCTVVAASLHFGVIYRLIV
jgi:hemolysin III